MSRRSCNRHCPHGMPSPAYCPLDECRSLTPGVFCEAAWAVGLRGTELPLKRECPYILVPGHDLCRDTRLRSIRTQQGRSLPATYCPLTYLMYKALILRSSCPDAGRLGHERCTMKGSYGITYAATRGYHSTKSVIVTPTEKQHFVFTGFDPFALVPVMENDELTPLECHSVDIFNVNDLDLMTA